MPSAESFIGTLLRNPDNFASSSTLPTCDVEFFRLLLQFWSVPPPAMPLKACRYRIQFNSLVDDLSPCKDASPPDDLMLALLDAPSDVIAGLSQDSDWHQLHLRVPSVDAPAGVMPWLSEHAPPARYPRVEHHGAMCIPIDRDALRSAFVAREMESGRMSVRRVQLMFRGGLYHVAQPPADGGGFFEVEVAHAAVLNEVRVTAIDVLTRHHGEWQRLTPDNSVLHRAMGVEPRLVPGFTVYGADSDAPTGWRALSSRAHAAGDALEVRHFIASNTRRRRNGSVELLARFLEGPMQPSVLWEQIDFHRDDDLLFWLVRRFVETKTKLKTFMTPTPAGSKVAGAKVAGASAADGNVAGASAAGASARPQLKQWPGKDAVQALAAWWIASTLVEADGHTYTEPELYSIFEELCAFQADYAVIRKELVRRGFLEAPVITENDDHTTSTTYRVSRDGLSEKFVDVWRSNARHQAA